MFIIIQEEIGLKDHRVTVLEKGGLHVQTSAGAIQFGVPPERLGTAGLYIYIYIYICIYIYIYVCVCECVRAYMYIYYIYMHT